MKHSNSLFRSAYRSGDVLAIAVYRRYTDELSSDIKLAQDNYYFRRLGSMTDETGLWRELASLGLVRTTWSSLLSFFTADNLNLFFADLSCASLGCDESDLADVLRMPLAAQPAFEFAAITSEVVSLNILFSSSPSFAAGTDATPLFHKALTRMSVFYADHC